MSTAPSAPARLASGTDVSAPPVQAGRNVSASIAPSADPDDTPSVNGVASGLRSSACMTTPATASVRADQARGEHARQAGDEEDLGVEVVGERARAVEALRAGRCAVDPTSGAHDDGGQQQRAEDGVRAPGLAPARRGGLRRATWIVRIPRAGPALPASRAGVVTVALRAGRVGADARRDRRRRARSAPARRSRRDASCGRRARRTARAGARASASPRWARRPGRALLQQHHAIADLPGELQVVRGHEQRQAALVGEAAQQLRDFDLVVEIECGGRLVEDEQPALGVSCSSSNWASALAITTRCFSPPLSVSKWRHSRSAVPVAASARRTASRSAARLEAERAEMGVAAHQREIQHGVVEHRVDLLRHHGQRVAPAARFGTGRRWARRRSARCP